MKATKKEFAQFFDVTEEQVEKFIESAAKAGQDLDGDSNGN